MSHVMFQLLHYTKSYFENGNIAETSDHAIIPIKAVNKSATKRLQNISIGMVGGYNTLLSKQEEPSLVRVCPLT